MKYIDSSKYIALTRGWKRKQNAERIKFIRALIYDVLKKERLLGFYYDNYKSSHQIDLIAEGKDKLEVGVKPLEVYINRGLDTLKKYMFPLQDFFYASSFSWNDKNCKIISELDKTWVRLIQDLGL